MEGGPADAITISFGTYPLLATEAEYRRVRAEPLAQGVLGDRLVRPEGRAFEVRVHAREGTWTMRSRHDVPSCVRLACGLAACYLTPPSLASSASISLSVSAAASLTALSS